MTKKRSPILIALVIFVIAALIIFSVPFLPRVFGNEETKALYDMKDTLHSYVEPKANDLIDLARHIFGSGNYKFEDGKLKYYMSVKTGDEFSDTITDIPALCCEIRDHAERYPFLSDENTEIKIDIENWANWIIRIDLRSNEISMGLNPRISVTDALEHCKEFETINVGGYWGYDVSIPDNFDSRFFSDFDVLKVLKIDDIEPKDKENEVREALLGLRGVKVTIGH